MKKGTVLLKIALILIGAVVFALCIFALPPLISSDKTGYYRPILMGMYIPAIPFFIALCQAWMLLGYIDKNKAFSNLSVISLKNIKYCATLISLLYAVGMPFIFNAADKDDAPGVVVIGLLIIFASFVIAVFAALLQKLFQNALDIKLENELTV